MLTTLSSKPVTAVANGLGILTSIFAVISWLIPDWFGQLTLPKAILVGLALAFATLFATAILLAMFAWVYRKFRPLDIPTTTTATAEGGELEKQPTELGGLEQRLADLEQSNSALQKRLADAESCNNQLSIKLEQRTLLSELEARLKNTQRNESVAQGRLAAATDACGKLEELIGDIKAGKKLQTPNSMKMPLINIQNTMIGAVGNQGRGGELQGERFVWEDCLKHMKWDYEIPMAPQFDLNKNVRFVLCLENQLKRLHDFENQLRELANQRKGEIATIHSQIETELSRRNHDAG